jgi:dihydroorotate dehydrogenase
MFYHLLKPLLFQLPPELAHQLSLRSLQTLTQLHLSPWLLPKAVNTPHQVWGLTFPNRVGLAAGLDKNGEYLDGLAALGFGFIEVGTVTPRAQTGNPAPRLFRLPQAQALINRMGFNNRGVDMLLKNIQASHYRGILGINIGKNFDTPLENASQDYLTCLEKVYPFADYITINLSSPNTPHLRQMQHGETLKQLLDLLKNRQQQLARQHGRAVPLLLKIAPDLTANEIHDIANTLIQYEMDGVIATNTTNSRDGVADLPLAQQQGGLSGAPLFSQSTDVVRLLAENLAGKIPIIGVGGITYAAHAKAKLDAGASLVQIYTGLIYQGPALVSAITQALRDV